MLNQIRKLLVSFATLALFAAKAQAQIGSPEGVAGAFVNAWNAHDVKAFDRLFTADAIWVPIAEVRVIGHADVVKGFEDIHTTWAKNTVVTAKDSKVQLIRPDVAVILFHLKFLQDGKEVPVLDRAMILVAVKEGDGWKITAGQLTKQHEGK